MTPNTTPQENKIIQRYQGISKIPDLTGQTFSRWIVLARGNNDQAGCTRWWCRCRCGTIKLVQSNHLRHKKSQSCGCIQREVHIRRLTTHGLAKTPEYRIWCQMKARCYNPNTKKYYNYGGRGIQVCDRWLHSFQNFIYDMGRRPKGRLMIERINNDGDYSPENCKWATDKEQNRNKRTNRWIEYQGKTLMITEWARLLHVKSSVLTRRLNRGWSVEQTLTTPAKIYLDVE